MSILPVGGYIQVDIAINQALSSVVRLRGRRIVAIQTPTQWTAAALTFKSGAQSDTLYDVYDDAGAEISVAANASRIVCPTGAKADALAALDWIQIRSGTTSTPVNQAAARTLFILVK